MGTVDYIKWVQSVVGRPEPQEDDFDEDEECEPEDEELEEDLLEGRW